MGNASPAKKAVDTLVVSDIHLGLPVSHNERLLELLDAHDFKRLVLNGDIFDDMNFNRLKRMEWNVLSKIRELSDPESPVEVVWIVGNHDEVLYELMSHLVGIPVFAQFEWTVNGKRILAMHGHQFDKLISRAPLATKAGSKFYYGIQKIEGKNHKVSRYLKQVTKKWRRSPKVVREKALAYGKTKDVDYILCGHTHQPDEARSGKTTYINSGSWVNVRPSYITVSTEGEAALNYFPTE